MTRLGRREVLGRGAAFAAWAFVGSLTGRDVLAHEDDPAFDAVSMDDALQALGGTPAVGSQVVLTAPDLAENGAVVPVTVESKLPGASDIFIVVEANPNPLCVRFTIPQGTDAFVSTRIKMAESSRIYAVVRANGRLYSAHRTTAVTVGGCG